MEKNVTNLLRIIKFFPPTFIIITFFIALSLIYTEQERELFNEQKIIEDEYLVHEKEQSKQRVETIRNYIEYEKKRSRNSIKR